MKFVLVAINAKYIHTGLAIYSLRSYAGEELPEHIEVAEYTINCRMEQILANLYKRKPDAIGFSCYIWNIQLVKRLIRELSKLLPDIPIWLGGPEVSYNAKDILETYPEVTGIMVGEGEETFSELLRAYVEEERKADGYGRERKELKSPAFQIPGTVTRDGFFGYREPMDMNRLVFCYEGLTEAEKNKIIYYESSRGCPFQCSYCLSSLEKQVRLRDVGLVKKELRYFLNQKVRQVKFVDRTFNCNREHTLQIWRFLLENDNGITNFHFEITAELLTEEELEILSRMRPGLIQLEIGVQTTNRETLRAIRRPAHLEKLKMTVMSIREMQNIHLHLDLIAGLPYENMESFRHSFQEVFETHPNQLQLGFLKVLKGSEMYEKTKEYGIICQSEPPYEVLSTKWLSYEDILELKKVEEMLELFYNSAQFDYTLTALLRFFENAYVMFLALAEFYEEQGLSVNSPARQYRYEVMLAFIESRKVGADIKALFGELLTFDLYLREKAKSRPAFAANIHKYYQKTTAFYKKQQTKQDLLADYVEKGYDSRQMMRMTHMEVFCYPVWDKKWLETADFKGIKPGKERFVLFDYTRRNPLNREAAHILISEEEL